MQQIIGTIMYYAHAIDLTTLVILSSIASEQAQAQTTENTEQRVKQPWTTCTPIKMLLFDMLPSS